MRNFLVIMALAFITIMGSGCVSNIKVDGQKLSEAEFNAYLVKHESQISLSSAIATRVTLRLVDEEDQGKFAQRAHSIATAINAATQQGPVDLGTVRAEVVNLIGDAKYKAVANDLLITLTDVVENYLNSTYANAPEGSRLKALQALIRGVTQGVINATELYLPADSGGVSYMDGISTRYRMVNLSPFNYPLRS